MFNLNERYFTDPVVDNFCQIANDGFNDEIYLELPDERFSAVIFIDMTPMWKDRMEKDVHVIADGFFCFP